MERHNQKDRKSREVLLIFAGICEQEGIGDDIEGKSTVDFKS